MNTNSVKRPATRFILASLATLTSLVSLSLMLSHSLAYASYVSGPAHVLGCDRDGVVYKISTLADGEATLDLGAGINLRGRAEITPETGATVYRFLNRLTFHTANTAEINGPASSAAEWNSFWTAVEVASMGIDYVDSRDSFSVIVPANSPADSQLTAWSSTRTRNPLDFRGAFAGRWRAMTVNSQLIVCR